MDKKMKEQQLNEQYESDLVEHLELVNLYVVCQIQLQKSFQQAYGDLGLARTIKGHSSISPDQYDYRAKAISLINIENSRHVLENRLDYNNEKISKPIENNNELSSKNLRRRNKQKHSANRNENKTQTGNIFNKGQADNTNVTDIFIENENEKDKNKSKSKYNKHEPKPQSSIGKSKGISIALKDPLYWFGMLPPASLHSSKRHFVDSLKEIVGIANLVLQINQEQAKLENSKKDCLN